MNILHHRQVHPARRSRALLWRGLAALILVIGGSAAAVAARQAAPVPTGSALATYGAPTQAGAGGAAIVAGPDSPTSFNATLPNGRRITPAGSSVQVGENPLNSVLTPDGQFLFVSNDDERNTGARNTATGANGLPISQAAVNGAGKTPGGYTLAVVRTADMQVVTSTLVPRNPRPNPGVRTPGPSQSDNTAALFLGLAVKANPAGGYTLYAAGGPSDVVYVYAVDATGMLSQAQMINVPVPNDPSKPNYGMAAPAGLTLSPDGARLYVVNNNGNNVVTIDTASNTVVGAPIPVGFFPYSSVLSPDGTKLYVSNWGVSDRSFNSAYMASQVMTTTPVTGTLFGTGSPNIGGVPGNLFANPVTDALRSSSISVINLSTSGISSTVPLGRPIDGINVVGGTHPSAMAVVQSKGRRALYVTNANEDALAIVDTNNDQLVTKVFLPSPISGLKSGQVPGLYPNALAVSRDNKRLFVAEAGLNSVAVYNVSKPFNPVFVGRIPTGWYPSGVTISPDGATLYVTNAKGLGSDYGFKGAVPGSPDVNLLFGTVQRIDLSGLDLKGSTAQVIANTFQPLAPNNAVLTTLQQNIQHVIFILRENKSYDTYLGNDAVLNGRGANGVGVITPTGATASTNYAVYDPFVPNTKKLAETFAVGDNVYADSQESNAGHSFALAGTSTDYQQKTLLSRFARPLINIKNEDPEDSPLLGYIFNHAARNNISYRNYGDMVRISGYDDGGNPNPCADDPYDACSSGTFTYTNVTSPTVGLGGLYAENLPALLALGNNHTDTNYPGWNLRISDARRAQEFIKDYGALIAQGQAPRFTFLWLPDDHTGGGLNPQFEVADNDAALGQIVQFISNSAIYSSTALFVTEDDAQGSPDHVSAHRTYTMVISPYAKRGAVIHRLSSTVSIPKTIEEMLGMPPMNMGDLLANDLLDYFTTTPDYTPYTALPSAKPALSRAETMRIAGLTRYLDMTSYDRDNVRLGQLNTLFFQSQRLAGQRLHMTAAAYDKAQAALYHRARAIVGLR